jgi:hypothetical protein
MVHKRPRYIDGQLVRPFKREELEAYKRPASVCAACVSTPACCTTSKELLPELLSALTGQFCVATPQQGNVLLLHGGIAGCHAGALQKHMPCSVDFLILHGLMLLPTRYPDRCPTC